MGLGTITEGVRAQAGLRSQLLAQTEALVLVQIFSCHVKVGRDTFITGFP